jgi:hypothetical protein
MRETYENTKEKETRSLFDADCLQSDLASVAPESLRPGAAIAILPQLILIDDSSRGPAVSAPDHFDLRRLEKKEDDLAFAGVMPEGPPDDRDGPYVGPGGSSPSPDLDGGPYGGPYSEPGSGPGSFEPGGPYQGV